MPMIIGPLLLSARGSAMPVVPAHNLSIGRAQLAGATAGRFAVFAGGYTLEGTDSDVVDLSLIHI